MTPTDAWVLAADLNQLLDRHLIFVTGKGGTGKTSVAASLALVASRRGLRTLVCEMDAKGDLAEAFGAEPFEFDAREVRPCLFGMSMDTERSLREYVRLFARIPLVTTVGPIASTLDFVADAAPGVKEILAVGKLCWEVREKRYDIVIVDAEASGHIVSQIAAPRVLQQLVRLGLIREQSEWMRAILEDPTMTSLVTVATPEEMPVTETIALLSRVRLETGVAVGAVIVNRCPEPFFDGELATCLNRALASHDELVNRFGHEVDVLLRMAEFHGARRSDALQQVGHLRAERPDVPILVLPELVTTDAKLVDELSVVLAEELG